MTLFDMTILVTSKVRNVINTTNTFVEKRSLPGHPGTLPCPLLLLKKIIEPTMRFQGPASLIHVEGSLAKLRDRRTEGVCSPGFSVRLKCESSILPNR